MGCEKLSPANFETAEPTPMEADIRRNCRVTSGKEPDDGTGGS
jgi:hypothetical protein